MHSNFDFWHFVGGIALSLPAVFLLASSVSDALWLQPPKSAKKPGWTTDIPFSRLSRFFTALVVGSFAANSFATAFHHDISGATLPTQIGLGVVIGLILIRDMRRAKSSYKPDA
ncbi:MAG TPA: hypothetical protein VGH42_08240 [Verrucomicrobiae bacterium]